jgi:hypothetical protein
MGVKVAQNVAQQVRQRGFAYVQPGIVPRGCCLRSCADPAAAGVQLEVGAVNRSTSLRHDFHGRALFAVRAVEQDKKKRSTSLPS